TVGVYNRLSHEPDGLMLNYEKWNKSHENILRFGKRGVYDNNFELSREGSSLKVQSQSEAANSPLDVTVSNFQLATLLNMVRKDELLADGTLNGEATLRDLTGTMSFTSDLAISEFQFQGNPVGDLSIKVNNQTPDTLAADVALTGNGNQLKLDRTYRLSSQGLNLQLNIDRLNVESVQGFTFGNIKDGEGYLSGKLDIAGTIPAPKVNGQLKFNDVGLRVTQLNSFFKDIDEVMTFDSRGIAMDKFTVYDQKDNRLIVDGRVLTENYRDYKFDMTVNAENFRAINSKAKDNDQFYGDLYIDADLDI